LMIVVAIIGILAAIAIPAFIEYINSGKGTEADLNLNKLAKSAKIYRQKNAAYPTADEGPLPATTACAEPNGTFAKGTFAPLRTAGSTFEILDFVIGDAFRYQYEWTSGDPLVFTASAIGDLDCDTVLKTSYAIGSVDGNGNPEVEFSASASPD
jgi:type IV pilus assembly protein PilA